MTRSEYEQRRRALEQQFQADLEMLRTAHQVRLRSLEQLWLALGDGAAASPPLAEGNGAPVSVPIGTHTGIGTQNGIGTPAPPVKAGPVRRGYGVIGGEVEDALARMPEVFDRMGLIRELGYEPPRSTLHRVLQELAQAGRIAIEAYSEGRTRTRYRKVRPPERREG